MAGPRGRLLRDAQRRVQRLLPVCQDRGGRVSGARRYSICGLVSFASLWAACTGDGSATKGRCLRSACLHKTIPYSVQSDVVQHDLSRPLRRFYSLNEWLLARLDHAWARLAIVSGELLTSRESKADCRKSGLPCLITFCFQMYPVYQVSVIVEIPSLMILMQGRCFATLGALLHWASCTGPTPRRHHAGPTSPSSQSLSLVCRTIKP